MKTLLFWVLLALVGFSACQTEHYKTNRLKDSNGYAYQTVTNDPYKARIYTLENGLTIYLTRNLDEPRIATMIGVNAGSTYEDPNATGLAHYMEHMMFKGTSSVGTVNWAEERVVLQQISDLFELHKQTEDPVKKAEIYADIDSISQIAATYVATNEFDKLSTSMGASMVNAGTSFESTVYMSEIPKNELERWAKLESDRFKDPVLRLFHTELETVYEEFNMYQDMDSERSTLALFEALFPTHPYHRDVIGYPEHLKNPSMEDIHKFKEKFYIPNNMSICMAGDLEFESTIQLIDQYFGSMEKKPLIKPEFIKEKPLTFPVIKEVVGPDAESILMAFRFDGIRSDDYVMVDLISSILSNGEAGLIDLNLVQEQKVLEAYSYSWFMRDYGMHMFEAYPREGQSLEELRELVLAELEKLKRGDFEAWLIEAIVNKRLLEYMEYLDHPYYAANMLMSEFEAGQSHAETLATLDKMRTITKEEIVAFANEKYHDNYALVYKRVGDNGDLVKVEKPEITPVPINRDLESDFAKEFRNQKVEDIQPVFVDYDQQLYKKNLKKGVDFYHASNESNALFELNYVIDMGQLNSRTFPLAVDYLSLLGTDKYTPQELRKELFRLGLSLSVYAGEERCYVTVSGLNEKLEEGIQLLEKLIHHAKSNQEVYDRFADGIFKEREDAKMNQREITSALVDYGMYGVESPGKNILSNEEIMKIDPNTLVEEIHHMTDYEHKVNYYGPSAPEDVIQLIEKYHSTPEILLPVPEPQKYEMRDSKKSKVFVVDYDVSQATIILLSKEHQFDSSLIPYANIFNNYFGSGLSSVVFQEIRESKALAYSAYASYVTARSPEKNNYIYAKLGTQVDKMGIATSTLTDLMNEMPKAESQFNQSCEGIVKKINTQRITNRSLFWNYLQNQDRGIDNDHREETYKLAQTITIDQFEAFFEEHIQGSNYTYMVFGPKHEFDMETLKKLGEIKELTLEDLFGY